MASYHPFLFLLICLIAIAELGLTAYLVNLFNGMGAYPSGEYESLIQLFLFNSIWTTLFGLAYVLFIAYGSLHFLASIASSAIWLVITIIFWGVASGMFHNLRGDDDCTGAPGISLCRENQTVEALGWTEFALCVVALFAACFWVHSSRRSPYDPYYV